MRFRKVPNFVCRVRKASSTSQSVLPIGGFVAEIIGRWNTVSERVGQIVRVFSAQQPARWQQMSSEEATEGH